MFRKVKAWVVEKLFGKDRRIAELETKVKRLEELVLANPHFVHHIDRIVEAANNNTNTIYYLLSKNHHVELEHDYLPGASTGLYRIVSKD